MIRRLALLTAAVSGMLLCLVPLAQAPAEAGGGGAVRRGGHPRLAHALRQERARAGSPDLRHAAAPQHQDAPARGEPRRIVAHRQRHDLAVQAQAQREVPQRRALRRGGGEVQHRAHAQSEAGRPRTDEHRHHRPRGRGRRLHRQRHHQGALPAPARAHEPGPLRHRGHRAAEVSRPGGRRGLRGEAGGHGAVQVRGVGEGRAAGAGGEQGLSPRGARHRAPDLPPGARADHARRRPHVGTGRPRQRHPARPDGQDPGAAATPTWRSARWAASSSW